MENARGQLLIAHNGGERGKMFISEVIHPFRGDMEEVGHPQERSEYIGWFTCQWKVKSERLLLLMDLSYLRLVCGSGPEAWAPSGSGGPRQNGPVTLTRCMPTLSELLSGASH